MALFIIKTLPTGVFVFNFVKRIYVTSRERVKLKQVELENLQLQIQIVNTKLSVRDAEFTERALELQRGTARLRRVRARVREVIAADDDIRRSLQETVPWDDDYDTRMNSPDAEVNVAEMSPVATDQPPDHSAYSSASDGDGDGNCDGDGDGYGDGKRHCRVKIVKVTNVYKVACLKHYIKQKRLRRDARQATLKKKMENVKKILDDWQKTLNMVINSKLSLLTMDSQYVEIASQEAMGDYTKQDFRETFDSDGDFRNFNDNYYEQTDFAWVRDTQRNYTSAFEDATYGPVSKELRAPQYDVYRDDFKHMDCSPRRQNLPELFILPEETRSQLAIAEVSEEPFDTVNVVST